MFMSNFVRGRTAAPITDLLLGVYVRVTTRTLSLPELPPEREQRLQLILDLHDRGLSTNEITDFLNFSKMKSPRGTSYTPKLVWVPYRRWV